LTAVHLGANKIELVDVEKNARVYERGSCCIVCEGWIDGVRCVSECDECDESREDTSHCGKGMGLLTGLLARHMALYAHLFEFRTFAE